MRNYIPSLFMTFAITLGGAAFAPDSAAQTCYVTEPQRFSLIEDCLDEYENEVVKLNGWARTIHDIGSPTFEYFVLTDEFGNTVTVRTTKGLKIGRQYVVEGIVNMFTLDNGLDIPVIHESTRYWVMRPYLIWGGVGVLALMVVGFVFYQTNSGNKGRRARVPESAAAPAPVREVKPSPTIAPEDPTVKLDGDLVRGSAFEMYVPQKTLKILGQLEFVGGPDKGKEIPLLVPASERGRSGAGHEFHIGREKGQPFESITLSAPTISRKQAKLAFVNGRFVLTNYASVNKNPTLVNGQPMDVGGQVAISDGDVITFGEIEVRLTYAKTNV